MFTIVNTLNKKQIQQVQELKLTNCKNLEIEIQCVKPKVLLGNWLWRFKKEVNRLWRQVIANKYCGLWRLVYW